MDSLSNLTFESGFHASSSQACEKQVWKFPISIKTSDGFKDKLFQSVSPLMGTSHPRPSEKDHMVSEFLNLFNDTYKCRYSPTSEVKADPPNSTRSKRNLKNDMFSARLYCTCITITARGSRSTAQGDQIALRPGTFGHFMLKLPMDVSHFQSWSLSATGKVMDLPHFIEKETAEESTLNRLRSFLGNE